MFRGKKQQQQEAKEVTLGREKFLSCFVSLCLSLPAIKKVFLCCNYKEHHLNEVIIR